MELYWPGTHVLVAECHSSPTTLFTTKLMYMYMCNRSTDTIVYTHVQVRLKKKYQAKMIRKLLQADG